jgi:hypothetical protein
MLGGDRLAFVTDGAPLVEGLLILWESSAVRPLPRQIAQPLSSAALSSDGSYLAWDLPPEPDRPASNRQSAVVIENLDTGRVGFVWTQTASGAPRPLTPAIASTPAGALVAWFASTPGGAVYPAFRFSYRSAGAVFANTSEPLWIGVEDGTLLWLAQGADSASVVAYALDVSNLGPA